MNKLEKAEQQYYTAVHLLTQTYPLIKDPKLLLGIINNIFNSLKYSIEAILAYEVEQKIVPNYPDDFQRKFDLFRFESANKHQIDSIHIKFIQEIKEMINFQKKSPVDFRRKEMFVICGEKYEVKTITTKEIEQYLDQTEKFLKLTNSIINRK